MRKTIITDDMLYSAASTAEDIIVESLNFDDGSDIIFSAEYRISMNKMIKEQCELMKKEIKLHKKFGIYNFMSKAAVFMLVFVGSLGVSFSVGADKGKLYEMLVQVEKSLTNMDFKPDEDIMVTELEAMTPQYIPKGFTQDSIEQDKEGVRIVYHNGSKRRILYEQKIFSYSSSITNTEDTVMEVEVIDGKPAYYYFNKECSYLIWDNGIYSYYLEGDINKEELIKMAESLK